MLLFYHVYDFVVRRCLLKNDPYPLKSLFCIQDWHSMKLSRYQQCWNQHVVVLPTGFSNICMRSLNSIGCCYIIMFVTLWFGGVFSKTIPTHWRACFVYKIDVVWSCLDISSVEISMLWFCLLAFLISVCAYWTPSAVVILLCLWLCGSAVSAQKTIPPILEYVSHARLT